MDTQKVGCSSCNQACFKDEIKSGLKEQNRLFVHSLGVCSAIALTTMIDQAVVIGIIILITASLSAFLVSLMRNLLVPGIRFIGQMAIITLIVTLFHTLLLAYWPEMKSALGPYLGLVITNCLIMGNCEEFAMYSKPFPSLKKAFATSIGYVLILIIVSIIREPIGNGTFLGIEIFKNIEPVKLVKAAPGAFFILGLLWWIITANSKKKTSIVN